LTHKRTSDPLAGTNEKDLAGGDCSSRLLIKGSATVDPATWKTQEEQKEEEEEEEEEWCCCSS